MNHSMIFFVGLTGKMIVELAVQGETGDLDDRLL